MFSGLGAAALYLFVKYIEYQNAVSLIDPRMVEVITNEGQEVLLRGQNYSDDLLGKLNGILHIPMLGASGAVFGLLAGYGMKFPNNELGVFPLPFFIKAKYFVLIYGAIVLWLGLSSYNTGIAHFAHLGGAIFGFFLIMYWDKFGSRL